MKGIVAMNSGAKNCLWRGLVLLAAGGLLLGLSTSCPALELGQKALGLTAVQEPLPCRAGGDCLVALKISLAKGMHIYSEDAGEEAGVPTRLEVATPAGLTAGRAVFPPAEKTKTSLSEKPVAMYEGEVLVRIPVRVPAGTAPGGYPLGIALSYQACDGEMCLMPETGELSFSLKVE